MFFYDSEEAEDDENSVSSIFSNDSMIRDISGNDPCTDVVDWDGRND